MIKRGKRHGKGKGRKHAKAKHKVSDGPGFVVDISQEPIALSGFSLSIALEMDGSVRRVYLSYDDAKRITADLIRQLVKLNGHRVLTLE